METTEDRGHHDNKNSSDMKFVRLHMPRQHIEWEKTNLALQTDVQSLARYVKICYIRMCWESVNVLPVDGLLPHTLLHAGKMLLGYLIAGVLLDHRKSTLVRGSRWYVTDNGVRNGLTFFSPPISPLPMQEATT